VAIPAEQAGQRIDNYLLTRLKGVPKSRIYRILRKGEVRVNKKRVAPGYRLKAGDMVRIPPVRIAETEGPGPQAAAAGRRLLSTAIHDDGRLLVIDKPAGLAVHGGSGMSFGVIEALRAAQPDAPYLELVHRLDRDTSGCLLVARRRSTLRRLHELLREGRVVKRYLALVRGSWGLGFRRQEDELVIGRGAEGERYVRVAEQGRRAASDFRPLDTGRTASLMEVTIHTGRTHQIRVQSEALGHPLAGDERYGDRDFNRRMRRLGLKRMFLHAAAIGFRDPVTGEEQLFCSPLPADLQAVLTALADDDG
jgi:23S rRNA pseudouridine955/2504/2580 synthase